MIDDFNLRDDGIQEVKTYPGWELPTLPLGYTHRRPGIGTDFESALDDLLEKMCCEGFDVTGLQGRLRAAWTPNDTEGDGKTTMYHIVLSFNTEIPHAIEKGRPVQSHWLSSPEGPGRRS